MRKSWLQVSKYRAISLQFSGEVINNADSLVSVLEDWRESQFGAIVSAKTRKTTNACSSC